jgi:hypothetical protein
MTSASSSNARLTADAGRCWFEFVVAAVQVLNERTTADDDGGRSVAFEAPYRRRLSTSLPKVASPAMRSSVKVQILYKVQTVVRITTL